MIDNPFSIMQGWNDQRNRYYAYTDNVNKQCLRWKFDWKFRPPIKKGHIRIPEFRLSLN